MLAIFNIKRSKTNTGGGIRARDSRGGENGVNIRIKHPGVRLFFFNFCNCVNIPDQLFQ